MGTRMRMVMVAKIRTEAGGSSNWPHCGSEGAVVSVGSGEVVRHVPDQKAKSWNTPTTPKQPTRACRSIVSACCTMMDAIWA